VGYQESQEAEKATRDEIGAEDSQLSVKSKELGDDQLVGEEHQDVGWGPDFLMYKELALHGPLRKRTQLVLLGQHVRAQKKDFNKKFVSLMHHKLDAIAKVGDRGTTRVQHDSTIASRRLCSATLYCSAGGRAQQADPGDPGGTRSLGKAAPEAQNHASRRPGVQHDGILEYSQPWLCGEGKLGSRSARGGPIKNSERSQHDLSM
jgi:hypothetical protein